MSDPRKPEDRSGTPPFSPEDRQRRQEIAALYTRGLRRRDSLRRPLIASIVTHLLMFVVAVVLARPRFEVPDPIPVIPVDLVSLPAPQPAEVKREEQPSVTPPEVIPDPLKKPPKPKPKPPEKKEPPKKTPEKETKKPQPRPPKPKQGTADTTQVVKSELPAVGDMKGALQMQVEGPMLPYTYYLRIVQDKIASLWEPPPVGELQGREVVAIVRFRIEKSGVLRDHFVEEPSGSTFFDRSALRALERAAPLPPLPQEYGGDYLVIHLRFVYTE